LEVGSEKYRKPMRLEAKTCDEKPTEKDEEWVFQIM
jgi:hypothetical protein